MLNILTFDIEGLIESSLESFYVPPQYISKETEKKEIEVNTMKILEILSEFDCKATFFILGRIAKDMPNLVKRISQEDHEIACHGLLHKRLYNLSPYEVKDTIRKAKHYLEDTSGKSVYGFRAPDFSINKTNIYVFDVLRELSFLYDSSIFPIGFHDVYGIGDFSPFPYRLKNGLFELPMPTIKVLKRIPFGGGGWFRLYPLFITKIFTKMFNRTHYPVIFYLHPCEIGEFIPRIGEINLVRKFRTYVGVKNTQKKLKNILSSFNLVKITDFLKSKEIT
jgi:polysaccharide deacetylase family protein (PEP-CTERM system associated)